MTPEATAFLQKAVRLLEEAGTMLSVDLSSAAGRTAFLAAFHGAQALIVEKTGRSPKTHKGVHSRFSQLIKDDPSFDVELRSFLSRAYNLKSAADYETGSGAEVSNERATAAQSTAQRFVAHIGILLG